MAFLGWGALSDYREFIIPNRICLAIALLYPAYVLTSPQPVDWMAGMIFAMSVLGITAILFSFGVLGGGDVKFYSSIALWAGPALAVPFLLVTAIAGGILAVVFMLCSRYGFVISANYESQSTNVPYGVAIAAGGMFVAGQLVVG